MASREFDRLELGGSKWGSIYKRKPGRDLGLEGDVFVPLVQSACLSLAVGSLVFAVAYPLLDRLAMYPIAVSMALAWCYEMFRAIGWVRDYSIHEEEYTSETIANASSEHSSVTVHVIEGSRHPGSVDVGGKMLIREIGVSRDILRLACMCDTISKRQLMSVGISDVDALQIVSQLSEFGFIQREANNVPANWTSRGKALRRALVGGGGGGGGGEKPALTSTIE